MVCKMRSNLEIFSQFSVGTVDFNETQQKFTNFCQLFMDVRGYVGYISFRLSCELLDVLLRMLHVVFWQLI